MISANWWNIFGSGTVEKPHMIEPGRYVSHAGFVEYLRECAGRWAGQPGDCSEQVRKLDAQAADLEARGEAACPVCRAAQDRARVAESYQGTIHTKLGAKL